MSKHHLALRVIAGAYFTCVSLAIVREGETALQTPAPTSTISFRFAPSDGVRAVRTSIRTSQQVIDGLGSKTVRLENRDALRYERSNDGFLIRAKLLSSELTVNGEAFDDPVFGALVDGEFRYRVGDDGQLAAIDGLDEVMRSVRASLPESSADSVRAMLSDEAMLADQQADWRARIGSFAGSRIAVGDAYDTEVPFILPNSEIRTYRMQVSLPRLEPCPAGSCAVIETRYLAPETTPVTASAAPAGKGPAAAADVTLLAVFSRRLVDPATMLMYAERVQSVTRTMTELPGRGTIPVVETTEQLVSFEYE